MASSKASSSSRIDASAAAAEAAFRTANAAASILARSKSDASKSGLPAPDLLLRHLDRAIAAAESAQTSHLLSLSSSPSFYASNLHLPSELGHTAVKTKNGLDARLVLEPEQMAKHLSTNFSEMEIAEHNELAPVRDVANKKSVGISLPVADSVLTKSRDESVAARTVNGQYDDRLADEAYRAGNVSLAEGDYQKSLKLLYLALSKCPPDKVSAVAKIRRLISLAVQQLQKTQRRKNPEPF